MRGFLYFGAFDSELGSNWETPKYPQEGIGLGGEWAECVRGCDNPDLDRLAADWRRKPAEMRTQLGGCGSRPFMGRGSACCPEGQPLKASCLSLGKLSPPGCRAVPGAAVTSQKT